MVANQKKIKINKPKKYDKDFMQIGVEEWQEAFKLLNGNPSAFAMYLYLASNKNGYEKELSSVAFKNATGKTRSSYHRALELLTKVGYIYEDNCGRLNFATIPKKGLRKAIQNWDSDSAKLDKSDANKKCSIIKSGTPLSQDCNSDVADLNTEIDKKHNTNNSQIYIDRERLNYLKKCITPAGQLKSGKRDGQWLQVIIPSFWELDRDAQIEGIKNKTDFKWSDAKLIVEHILDYKEHERMEKLFKELSKLDEE